MQGQEQQMSFAEYELSLQRSTPKGKFLEQMERIIPWEEIERKCIEVGVYKPNRGQQGRPSLPCRVLVGSLFLQAWYALSDPQTEELIGDRLSFRSFLGIGLEGVVPDETTLCKFRNKMIRMGLMKWIFDLVRSKMDEQGFILRGGQIVDATIISTARPRLKEVEGGKKEKQEYDEEAGYTKKREQIYYGYKLHILTDRRGLVKRISTSSASVHDSQQLEELLEGVEVEELYGDSGYMSKEREAKCKERGIKYRVIRRRVRGEGELSEAVRKENAEIAKVRGIVELPFAIIKRWMGYRVCRFRGLEKNGAYHFLLMAMYNLKRCYGMIKKGVQVACA
ncbi:MAG TPA: IS5 family transposase [Candidatus Hydrogenedens sp.]|nr:IS5 family transposase [Candidatus Hydrogenedens sp.]